MGTSSARRGPTGHLWRLAKGAASRYLSPANDGAVEAREVVARYVAALGEGGGPGLTEALAVFRLTRKTAQNLGALCCRAESRGWPAALQDWGVANLAGEGPEALAQSLGVALEAPGGGLEQAVTHAALVGVLLALPASPGSTPKPARLVRGFLADAFRLRLALDLGESLEAAAPGFFPLRQGLTEMAGWIDRATVAPGPPAAPLTAAEWLGLPGWTWVTNILASLMLHFREPSPAQD